MTPEQEKIIQAIADGTKSASRITTLSKRKDSEIDYHMVVKYCDRNQIPMPRRIKPTYQYIYQIKTYTVYLNHEAPGWFPGHERSRFLIELAKVKAIDSENAINLVLNDEPKLPKELSREQLREFNHALANHINERKLGQYIAISEGNYGQLQQEEGSILINYDEKAELEKIIKTVENSQIDLSYNEYLQELADWEYPDIDSWIVECQHTWKKIERRHGSQLVNLLLAELNPNNSAKIYTTTKNFRWFLKYFGEIYDTGRSPRPILGSVDLPLPIEGLFLQHGWQKVHNALMIAATTY